MTILSPILRSRYFILRKAPILRTLLACLLLFALLPTFAQSIKLEANPIYLAAILTEKNDSAKIASICEYYGYHNHPTQDGYTEFQHPNGSIIRFTFSTAEDGKPYSTIEVKSKAIHKELDEILKNLKFSKIGNNYERRSYDHQTRCVSLDGTLQFINQPKTKK